MRLYKDNTKQDLKDEELECLKPLCEEQAVSGDVFCAKHNAGKVVKE